MVRLFDVKNSVMIEPKKLIQLLKLTRKGIHTEHLKAFCFLPAEPAG